MESAKSLDQLPDTPTRPETPTRDVNGIWVFIVGDLFIFGAYFVVYALTRRANEDLFLASQQLLDQRLGVFNTLILLTSSWFVATAIKAQREGRYELAGKLTLMTMGWGLIFLASKFTEWMLLIGEGHTFTSNQFFQFYFFMTGVHVLHVLFGMIALARLYIEMRFVEGRNNDTAESCAVFWHMVDVLWIIIFPLIYLLR